MKKTFKEKIFTTFTTTISFVNHLPEDGRSRPRHVVEKLYIQKLLSFKVVQFLDSIYWTRLLHGTWTILNKFLNEFKRSATGPYPELDGLT